MVKVTGPLYSFRASGDLASAVQYVCGKYARMKPRNITFKSKEQEQQRNLFIEGAIKWKNTLTEETKTKWEYFRSVILMSKECAVNAYQISSYNLWMSYWLRFKEDGWKNYPDPPIP